MRHASASCLSRSRRKAWRRKDPDDTKNAAKSAGADVRELLLVREGKCKKNRDGDCALDKDADASTTPLFLLLENERSAIGSFELACRAWPDVVFLTCRSGATARDTILHCLLFDASDREDETLEARHVELVRLFLRTAAAKSYGGASGLASATSNDLIGVDKFKISQLNRGNSNALDCDPTTAVHLGCADMHGSAQSSVLQTLMKSWPDQMLCCIVSRSTLILDPSPFTTQHMRRGSSVVKNILVPNPTQISTHYEIFVFSFSILRLPALHGPS